MVKPNAYSTDLVDAKEKLKTFIIFDEKDVLDDETYFEISPIFVTAKSMQDALNIYADDFTMTVDEISDMRILEIPSLNTGSKFTLGLYIKDE